ncbi:hypothetical protein [Sulfitobacter sp. R18_1]|uniref:hypothetical protein n=1 Tax=Sulfitobacter sp. R18_1 TaxID=2821104 RepID=UPI001ADD0EDA|nr:hypothetical protein [Sulfitobacter sp. R18_1]MBO9428572.1 hypothetical protein [Sulfitobacter sp. R18_1]
MYDDPFVRPKWLRWLPVLMILSLLTAMGSIGLLITFDLSGFLLYVASAGTLSPFFVLLAVVPVLNNEIRLVDSFRDGLIGSKG